MNPFAKEEKDQVKNLGERRLIQCITRWAGDSSPPPPGGIGDDAAVLDPPMGKLIATKDSLVLGKHFTEKTQADQVGAKLLKRNLSDLAAMGASPTAAIIACLLPPTTSVTWLKQFYLGLKNSAETFKVSLIGGDITSTCKDLAFTLTLLGEAWEAPLTRKTALAGDTLWVTGSLGGSLLEKHLTFEPRIKEGLWLAKQSGVSSAMDISDGLATDLHNLCPVNCTIELNTDSLPISKSAEVQAASSGKRVIEHALTDGEDYELLFTMNASIIPHDFIAAWQEVFDTRLTCIGKMMTRSLNDKSPIRYTGTHREFSGRGFEHF